MDTLVLKFLILKSSYGLSNLATESAHVLTTARVYIAIYTTQETFKCL